MDCPEIQVWYTAPEDPSDRLLALLDAVERERTATFRRPVDAARFVTGAALVRVLAGRHLGVDPRSVTVVRHCHDCLRPHGRVTLPDTDLQISVSHSGAVVAVAACAGANVGVDVEEVGMWAIEPGMVGHVLAPPEEAQFATVPTDARTEAFLRYWTRKEALVKMTGDGLRVPLTDLIVSGPDDPPALVSWAGRQELFHSVQLYDLPTVRGHVGALAVQSRDRLPVRIQPAPVVVRA